VQHLQLDAGDRDPLSVGQRLEALLGIACLPKHLVVGVQPDRATKAVGELAGHGHVVVVGMGAQDGQQATSTDQLGDRPGRMRSVDEYAFGVVAEHPDVVVDVPGAPSTLKAPAVTVWSMRPPLESTPTSLRSLIAPPPSAAPCPHASW